MKSHDRREPHGIPLSLVPSGCDWAPARSSSSLNQSAAHSHTLPAMSCAPQELFRTFHLPDCSPIGRGGECKFLSHDKMFLDTFCNILFTQWFQRKILKTSPSGFAVEFKHPVLCIFLVLRCFWSCDNGLHRPHGTGESNSPLQRMAQCVFQDLHEVGDSRVAEKATEIMISHLPVILAIYYH